MKKILIGALVGAILIFIWQSLAHTVLSHHNAGLKQAPNSQAILDVLSANIKESGRYMLPDHNPNATAEEMHATNKALAGKPWALINYNTSWDTDMVTPMIRQFTTNFLAVALFIWLLGTNGNSFSTVFFKTLALGVIIFLSAWYPQNIWFQLPWDVIKGELIDLLVGWGLAGLWLGYYLNRRTSRR